MGFGMNFFDVYTKIPTHIYIHKYIYIFIYISKSVDVYTRYVLT